MRTLINPRNQGGLRYLFDISDPHSNPEHIEMGSIQPTIDMSMGGYARMNDYSQLKDAGLVGVALSGQQTATFNILSYGNVYGIDPQIVVPIGHCCVVWGIKMHLQMSAADAGANNGKYAQCVLQMIAPTIVSPAVTKWNGTFQVNTNQLLYSPGTRYVENITRDNVSVIPPSTRLAFTIWWETGGNFPNSAVFTYSIVGQCFPVGGPLPTWI